MAEETLYCPSCNRKVRVPEELLGQPVQCPLCRLIFTAPLRGQAPVPFVQPAPGQPFGAPPGPGIPDPVLLPGSPSWPEADTSAARAAVRGPAIGLLIVGILGLIANTFGLVMAAWLLVNGTEGRLEAGEQFLPPTLLEAYKDALSPESLRQSLIIHGACLALSVIICQAGTHMVRLRSHRLAVVASVLAMINFEVCCCVLGLPIGIWSLVVLLRPGMRDSFQ